MYFIVKLNLFTKVTRSERDHPPSKFQEDNVYSCVCLSICLFTVKRGRGVLCDHYPWCIGPHHTGIPFPRHIWTCSWISLYRSLQTCSSLYLDPTLNPRPLVRLASGRFASYLNDSCYFLKFSMQNLTRKPTEALVFTNFKVWTWTVVTLIDWPFLP